MKGHGDNFISSCNLFSYVPSFTVKMSFCSKFIQIQSDTIYEMTEYARELLPD